jgi:hypothetical protein
MEKYERRRTDVFLLFVYVADLKPDVGMCEGARWVS